MVNWDFLTTPNKLVRKITRIYVTYKLYDIYDIAVISYSITAIIAVPVKYIVKYLNGQTALDWIRMGYLNELIVRDLNLTSLTITCISTCGNLYGNLNLDFHMWIWLR